MGGELGINGGHVTASDVENYLNARDLATGDVPSAAPAVTLPHISTPTSWGLRHAALDIETSGGFNTSFGRVLCCAILIEGEHEPRLIDGFRLADERLLLVELHRLWADFDILVTFNGKRFDSRFLNGRCVQHGLPPLPQKMHLDLYPYVRKWRMSRSNLGTACEALGLPDQKGHVPSKRWLEAMDGDRIAYNEIAEYCKQDVRVLPELLERTRPFITKLSMAAF